jgi:predicted helicase
LYDSDDEDDDDDAVSCDEDAESEGANLSFKRFLQRAFPSDDANAKGRAFEEFLVDWFLKTYPEYKTKFAKVWPYADWPKPRSDIPDVDEGIDIIAQDTEGKICAIQAKCWNANSKLPYGELATFLASSSVPYIDYRLLIATCDVGRKAARQIQLQNEQKQIHAFLLSDFARWEIHWPESLDALRDFIPRQPLEPESYQLEAIDTVCEGLAEHGKGQLIMACGTGKTLTGQRIAEKLSSKTTLVLVPSLVLLNNTMTNWLTERKQDFVFLAVCSDESVAKRKDTSFTTTDLHCRVTTTPAEIADFLNRDANTNKVIFSTYQSSPRVADTFESGNLGPFDLVIADEAHRCAGRVSTDFSTVLKPERLPAKYRLFMTATPKVYTSRVSEFAQEYDIDVASMDDASLFGPVLHRLTFREAIDKELLADYRVVVVGVNEARYRDMVNERLLVKTECGSFKDDAKTLAARLGLANTIQTYDLNRIITFHSRVKRADEFANGFREFLNVMKPEFKPTGAVTYKYVSGEMPTSQRSRYLREMRELENEDRYLLANCRCLSEGVDVPALDGVAFLDPKNAEVDIVQAVGRVMRRDRTRVQQKSGTIVIPIFISDEDDADKALKSSNFSTVWKVVRALRSHDEVLGQELDQLRVKLGRERASGNIDLTLNHIHFDLHETVGDDFSSSVQGKNG